ncbi:MAG: O-methyltransferase [Lachnospiraceae bacterium]|nr:O-methyltransferase [Lachnospiraceae bacterium]
MRIKENEGKSLASARAAFEYENLRDERMEIFLESLIDPLDSLPYLRDLEKICLDAYVPVIRKPTQRLLSFEMRHLKPKRILEVGTALGFSAILMAKTNPADCRIDTIESFDERIPKAAKHFEEAGVSGQIHLLHGDAGDLLQDLIGQGKTYDFIFLDAAKGQYPVWLPLLKKLLDPAGLLMTDNILMEGDIIEPHFAIPRRNRTIHKRIREYLKDLTTDPELSTEILPIGDGIALTVKNTNP